ncbi:MAG: hypothetical protein CVU71_16370 [Deltaproteobacteria bacterium HGW-Deltaproteobacteria-6]|jgi:stalled ribosome rescue protein Dom34|nr:MAG: hypothetical protein CVU71_16370 [Deltaproteobacteria bacterium HGW-Deltaproteobacteria-6]
MPAKTGLWIDHRKAVIITLEKEIATLKIVKSEVEKHPRAAGSTTLKGPFKAREIPADDRHENEFNEHIGIFYNKIIEMIRHADAVYIFGPGEAKNELRKQLEKNNLGGLITDVRTTDRMTDHQVLAMVCQYFNAEVPNGLNLVESPHQRMKTSPSSHPRQP